MRRSIQIILTLGFIAFASSIFAVDTKDGKACIHNLVQVVGVCTYVSAGEVTGMAVEQSFGPLPQGGRRCYDSPMTVEQNADSLHVSLCNGGVYQFKDPICYQTIQPGQTLIITGVVSPQDNRRNLKDEKCYIAGTPTENASSLENH